MTFNKALDYNDITLVPRKISEQEHRNGDTSIECFGIKLDMPIIAAPMPDVCNGEMAAVLSENGALGIIHRFQSIELQSKEFLLRRFGNKDALGNDIVPIKEYFACAVGVTGDYQDRFKALYNVGCRIFCLDTANGANIQVKKAVDWIKEFELKQVGLHLHATTIKSLEDVQKTYINDKYKIYLIAGNVATKEGYTFLADLKVDAARVGISGGSVCLTRTETGVYVPMVTAINECVKRRKDIAKRRAIDKTDWKLFLENRTDIYKKNYQEELKSLPLIIADGGIKKPADANKALALGADLVMMGGMFAGTKESPGPVIKGTDGKLYKMLRGAASFGVQKEYTGKEPKFNEGNEVFIEYKHQSAAEVIERFKAGLQSSMSYMNAKDLNEFRQNVDFMEI